jgi:hypothetical protein
MEGKQMNKAIQIGAISGVFGFLLGICGISFPDWRFFVLMIPFCFTLVAWKNK